MAIGYGGHSVQLYDPATGQWVGGDAEGAAQRQWEMGQGKYKDWLDAQMQQVEQGGGYGEAQLQRGLGQAQQQMASQAVSRGANPLAERAALYSGGQMARQTNLDAAAARAQEMQSMREMMSGYYGQRLGGQMSWEQMNQQERQQQADQAWKQKQWDQQQSDRGAAKVASGLESAASMAGMAGMMMSDMGNKTGITVAGAPMGGSNPAYAAPAPVYGSGMAGGGLQVANNQNQAWNAAQQSQGGGTMLSDARAKRSAFEAGIRTQVARDAASPDPPLTSRGATAPFARKSFEATRGPVSRGVTESMFREPGAADEVSREMMRSAILGAGRSATGGAADEVSRQEESLGDESAAIYGPQASNQAEAEQDELARRLKLYEYEYRPEYEAVAGIPPGMRGGRRVGVMAQDLASSPIGRKAVMETPNGLGIDRDQALGLGLGLTGRQAERTDDLEKRLAALEARRGRRA